MPGSEAEILLSVNCKNCKKSARSEHENTRLGTQHAQHTGQRLILEPESRTFAP